jgi:hypothetical protein
MKICDYKGCEREAVIEGFVITKQEDSTYRDVTVWTCNDHKNTSGFFVKITGEERKKELKGERLEKFYEEQNKKIFD